MCINCLLLNLIIHVGKINSLCSINYVLILHETSLGALYKYFEARAQLTAPGHDTSPSVSDDIQCCNPPPQLRIANNTSPFSPWPKRGEGLDSSTGMVGSGFPHPCGGVQLTLIGPI